MDSGLGEEVVVLKVPGLPGNRLVFASTGPVNRDYDDVRNFSDAAVNGIKRFITRFLSCVMFSLISVYWFLVSVLCFSSECPSRALKAGMQRPLLVCPPHKDYSNSNLVAALGALHALYMVRKNSFVARALFKLSINMHLKSDLTTRGQIFHWFIYFF